MRINIFFPIQINFAFSKTFFLYKKHFNKLRHENTRKRFIMCTKIEIIIFFISFTFTQQIFKNKK
jgi:hypothetical protein